MDEETPNAAEMQAPEPQPPVPLDRLKRLFRLSMQATDEANKLSVRDRDYYDGDQLSANIRRKLMEREQPLFYTNKIQPAVNGVLGIFDAGESDPQAFPRNQNARAAADVATKLLRHVADKANLKKVRKDLSENFITQGVCAAIVECHDNGRGMHEVSVQRIRWEDFFFDHMSRESDFADAEYLGTAKWMNAETVRATFPEEFAKLGDPFDAAGGGVFDSKADLEARRWWIDTEQKRVRVVDMYHKDERGIWCRSIFCEQGFLYFGDSEYQDETGMPVCPIVATSYEIKQDNTRYGLVRNMIPLQDECNTLRGKLLHLVNTRQVRQTDLAAPAASKDTARKEAQKPNGAIPYGWEPVPTTDMQQGTVLILQRAEADLDRLAPTPAILGRIASSSESGRARQMLQQAGYTELARGFSRFEQLERRIHDQIWMRIRQFYTAPMEVRITGQGRAPEFLMINEPVIGPVQQVVTDPATGEQMMQIGQGIVRMNRRPADMDVDIIFSTVPDTVNLEQEVWEKMLELVGTLQISPLDPSFDMILKLSPIPNIDEKIEQIRAMREEAQQATAQQAQQQQAFAQAQAKSEFELKQAKANKENALAQKANLESAMMAGAPPQMPQGFPPLN